MLKSGDAGKLSAALMCFLAWSAHATDSAIRIDVPAGSLLDAIETIEKQFNVEIVYQPEALRGFSTNGVSGTLTTQEAVTRLLQGTQLRLKTDASTGAMLIVAGPRTTSDDRTIAEPAADSGLSRRTLHLMQATQDAVPNAARTSSQNSDNSSSDSSEKLQMALEEVLVQGVRFHEQQVGTALRMPLSVKDTPQTVMAITGDVMDFAAIKSFQDVYKIDATGGTTHRVDFSTVSYYRGFRQQSNNAVRIDGFRLRRDFNLDFALFERLEVVKGSTSTMYGQNSIAGTLNAISKMPKDHFGGEFKAELGSFDHGRVDVDLYGPLTDDGALTYRVVGARLDEGSYLDHGGQERTVFAPTLQYRFGPDTLAYARVSYQKSTSVPNFPGGLQYLGDLGTAFDSGFDPSLLVIPDLPRSRLSGATWNEADSEVLLVQASVTHRFANDWTLRVNAQNNRQDLFYNWLFPIFIQADGVPLANIIERSDSNFRVKAAEASLYGDIELFGRRHTLFFGADYSSVTNPKPALYTSVDVTPTQSIFSPAFNTSTARPVLTDYTFYYQTREQQRAAGITTQLILRPTDKLTVLLGGRLTRDDYAYFFRADTNASLIDSTAPYDVLALKKDKFTGQAGVTYAITPRLNAYASYGQSYEPQINRVAPDRFAGPEEGVAKEIGLKGETSARFAYSLALFEMTRSNIAQNNPLAPGFVVPIGTQRSRGIEAAVQGTLLPGWELFGSVGLMDAEYVDGEFAGYRPENAPKLGLSLFTSYEFQQGRLRGVGIGAGVAHKSGRKTFFSQGDLSGSPLQFDFGDATEVDLRLFRHWQHWRVQLAATNLLDQKYYSASLNNLALGVNVNPGRSVIGQLSYQF